MTLAAVSAATDISVSTLSRLESGQRKPTLELLLPLARTFGVTLDDLVDDPPAGDPRVHLRPRKGWGGTIIPLTPRSEGLQAFKHVITDKRQPPDLKVHDGYEWIYVLDGRLRLIIGDRDLVLTAGEVAEFDTRLPHWFGNADDQPVEFLSLFGPQGERAHVRARPASRD